MLIAPRCVRLLMLSVSTYAEFQKGVLHYAEYCNSFGAYKVVTLDVIMQNVVVLNVVAPSIVTK